MSQIEQFLERDKGELTVLSKLTCHIINNKSHKCSLKKSLWESTPPFLTPSSGHYYQKSKTLPGRQDRSSTASITLSAIFCSFFYVTADSYTRYYAIFGGNRRLDGSWGGVGVGGGGYAAVWTKINQLRVLEQSPQWGWNCFGSDTFE